jgi:hypothetical protein
MELGWRFGSTCRFLQAAETPRDPNLDSALSQIKYMTERTKPFVELLETFGPVLVERIVAAYRECSLELIIEIRLFAKLPEGHTRGVATAAA